LRIRDYQPDDFPALCDIDRRCFPPGIAYSADDIEVALLEPGTFVVVGEEPDAPADPIAGFILARQERGGRGHIITIDVLDPYRRSGLGTMLLDETHRRLRAVGTRRVLLEVSVENAPAQAFYRKHGYEASRRLRRYYNEKEDAWQMVKTLD
jgi:[ribosomal protein S18]-alanine N-acetyltransferase